MKKTARITVRLYPKRTALAHLHHKLRKLTFGAAGEMWAEFKSRYRKVQTLLAWRAGEVIGWAIASARGVMLYVHARYRRMGVGRRLMHRALQLRARRDVHVFNWNAPAHKFFSQFDAGMTLEFGYLKGKK